MLKIHQCYHKWKDVLFHDWIIFHCIILPHLLYPLIHWWALRMFRELLLLFLLFSQSVMSNSSRHHERQDGRLPCPEFTISQNLLKIMSIESMTPSNHLFLCYPLLLLWIFPSIGVFSNKLALCIKWSKYQSFSIRPLNEYSGLIILRTDWFDLLAVQGTLKNLLQYHSSKASILWHSAFFMVQFSHPYMITRKPIALTIQTLVHKSKSLLFICCLSLS